MHRLRSGYLAHGALRIWPPYPGCQSVQPGIRRMELMTTNAKRWALREALDPRRACPLDRLAPRGACPLDRWIVPCIWIAGVPVPWIPPLDPLDRRRACPLHCRRACPLHCPLHCALDCRRNPVSKTRRSSATSRSTVSPEGRKMPARSHAMRGCGKDPRQTIRRLQCAVSVARSFHCRGPGVLRAIPGGSSGWRRCRHPGPRRSRRHRHPRRCCWGGPCRGPRGGSAGGWCCCRQPLAPVRPWRG